MPSHYPITKPSAYRTVGPQYLRTLQTHMHTLHIDCWQSVLFVSSQTSVAADTTRENIWRYLTECPCRKSSCTLMVLEYPLSSRRSRLPWLLDEPVEALLW